VAAESLRSVASLLDAKLMIFLLKLRSWMCSQFCMGWVIIDPLPALYRPRLQALVLHCIPFDEEIFAFRADTTRLISRSAILIQVWGGVARGETP
jgi:hypothetical protein